MLRQSHRKALVWDDVKVLSASTSGKKEWEMVLATLA